MTVLLAIFRNPTVQWRNGAAFELKEGENAVRCLDTTGGRCRVWFDYIGNEWQPHPWHCWLKELLKKWPFLTMVLRHLCNSDGDAHMVPMEAPCGSPIQLFERAREEVQSIQRGLGRVVKVELRYPDLRKKFPARSITTSIPCSRSSARDFLFTLRSTLMRDDVRILAGNNSFKDLAKATEVPLLSTQHLMLVLGSLPTKEGREGFKQLQVPTVRAIVTVDREARPSKNDVVIVLDQGAGPGQVRVGFRNDTIASVPKCDLKLVYSRVRWNQRDISVRFFRSEIKRDSVVHNALIEIASVTSSETLARVLPSKYAGWPRD